jgi:hypothetical protein
VAIDEILWLTRLGSVMTSEEVDELFFLLVFFLVIQTDEVSGSGSRDVFDRSNYIL